MKIKYSLFVNLFLINLSIKLDVFIYFFKLFLIIINSLV